VPCARLAVVVVRLFTTPPPPPPPPPPPVVVGCRGDRVLRDIDAPAAVAVQYGDWRVTAAKPAPLAIMSQHNNDFSFLSLFARMGKKKTGCSPEIYFSPLGSGRFSFASRFGCVGGASRDVHAGGRTMDPPHHPTKRTQSSPLLRPYSHVIFFSVLPKKKPNACTHPFSSNALT
jgi:hypothetical protein